MTHYTIHTDTDAFNPRIECDNLGHIAAYHKRYNLGDTHAIYTLINTVYDNTHRFSTQDRDNVESAELHHMNAGPLFAKYNLGPILPLYFYEHSNISISTTPFGCQWDSGQVGYIFTTWDEVRAEWGGINQHIKNQAINILESEVSTYNAYLSGEVYGYTKTNDNGDIIDSCWGFYGYDYIQQEIEQMKQADSERESTQ